MTGRVGSLFGALAVAAAIVWSSVAVSTQHGHVPALVITAYNGGAPIPYTPARTPWGEPDLQGVWSSDDTAGIPRERPAELGTRLYQTDQEFAARVKQVKQGVERGQNAVGSFRNDYATRAFRQTSIIVDPPDGRMPATTPAAEKRRASRDRGTFGDGPFNTFADFTLYDRCITRGIVGSVLRVIYGNGNRIVQSPGVVAFSYEMIHDTRIIYTDGRPHINQAIRQYLGDSRAHWDGDVLVVETTNLTDKTSIGGNGNGLRHSDKMKITEMFKRVAPDIVQYQFTIDDPITYERPFTMSMPLTPLSGGVLLPYDCHEGNQAVHNALSAERAEDKALADDLAKGIKRTRRGVQESGVGGGGNRGRGAGTAPAAPAGGRGRGADPEDANQ
ncbi:MAG TPA: hypothetical protein VKB50_04885 [Vicinamibacterales bacterium]|nr:hypothetical protein [Vicinamibacterales bacterium]